MKKVLCLMIAASFILASSVAFANTEDLAEGMGNKALTGIVNIFTGWIEIPNQIAKGYKYGWMGKYNTGVVGAVGGIFAGVGSATGRTISGMGQVAGFWAADPESNEGVGIPLDAKYAWEEGTHYDMTDPSFTEATTKPVLNKLGRGLGNFFFGIAEVPGQIMIGIEEKAWDAGLFKGIWYFLSREVDGAWDICTFFLPGPRDNEAVAFDQKWAWSAMGDRTGK